MKAHTYLKSLQAKMAQRPAVPVPTRSKNHETKLLKELASGTSTPEDRARVLGELRAFSFSSPTYKDWKLTLIDTLRQIVQHEPKSCLTIAAFEVLAQERDGWAISALEKALHSPRGAAISAYDALRLLAYDDHGSHLGSLHNIASDKKRSGKMRLATLRQLGSDPSASDLLSFIAKDQQESSDIRRRALVALRQADFSKYQSVSTGLINDDAEDEQVKAQCITALSVDGASPDVVSKVRELQSRDGSGLVQIASNKYMNQSGEGNSKQ
jgi:hypothetical protein